MPPKKRVRKPSSADEGPSSKRSLRSRLSANELPPKESKSLEPADTGPINDAREPAAPINDAKEPADTAPINDTNGDTAPINDANGDAGTSYWLLKAEPESRIEKGKDVKFSIDDLEACKEPAGWDGGT
jgi:hypothetical protein